MRLIELTESKKRGTYAAVRFSDDTVKRIKTFIEENEIPNPISANKLHTTVLYSRKYCPDYKAAGTYDTPLVGKPKKFDLWKSQPDEDGNRSNCLVLAYDCPELVKRHKSLMDEHKATFDFDQYRPHVTLSYDAGADFDVNKLKPQDVGNIEITKEYMEDLDLDWAKNNAKK